MTDEERNQKMLEDYIATADMLQRSIQRLRERKKVAKYRSDKTDIDRSIGRLECYYYDVLATLSHFGVKYQKRQFTQGTEKENISEEDNSFE
jgi:hypothetical protein